MTEILKPDICVIGAGAGGLSVAAIAAAFGVSTVLVEKGKMGGDCLNYGCVPSKAMIASAKIAQVFRKAGKFGITPQEPTIDFEAVNKHVHNVIATIEPNDSVERFSGLGVKVIKAAAHFSDKRTVIAGDYEIRARRIVIATGSEPCIPPIPGLEDIPYFTNENLFDNTRCPDHLIVIGGGPIGMEMAQAHRRLGARVSVIEMDQVLGRMDRELTAIALTELRREGIDIHESTQVVRVEQGEASAIDVIMERDGQQSVVSGSHLLIAAGRMPSVNTLGLENAGIDYDLTGINIDTGLRTTNRRVYAIGDASSDMQFTHVAGYHAGLAIRSILFRMKIKEERKNIPSVTFLDPEIALVGVSEATARKQHGDIRVLRWPYVENDRAQAEGQTTGLIKVVTDKKGKILGAAIVGHGAGEMINIWSLAISQNLKVGAMTGYIAPYPTMTEIGKRASTEFYKPGLSNPWVKRIIAFLRIFG